MCILLNCKIKSINLTNNQNILKGYTLEKKLANGLVAQHAYSIFNIVEVEKIDKKSVNLIQLKNPWGKSSDFIEYYN